MQEHRETYKGRTILVRVKATGPTSERDTELGPGAAAEESAEPALYIDDEPVHVIRDNAGMYIAAGFAYAPQDSLIDLAKGMVDYREASAGG